MKTTQYFLTLTLALTAGTLFAQAPAGEPPADGGRPKPPIMTALDADGDGIISAAELANAPAALKKLLKNGADHLTMEDLRPPRREGEPQNDGPRGGDAQRPKRGDGPQAGPGSDGPPPSGNERRRRPDGPQGSNAETSRGGPQSGPQGGAGNGGPGGGRRGLPPLIAALDADKDGNISSAEINAATTALKTLDKNGDGQLTMDEIRPAPPQGGGSGKGPGAGAGPRPEAAGPAPGGKRRPDAE